jgi:hypothetical protein
MSTVEFRFVAGIFVAAWMVTGTIAGVFTSMIKTYLLEAIADPSHICM